MKRTEHITSASEVTYIPLGDGESSAIVCNNCGASVVIKNGTIGHELQHYETCQPGEAKKWEEYYNSASWKESLDWDEEDDEEDE